MKILCVCSENTVRSPLAQWMLSRELPNTVIDSAGIDPASFSNPLVSDQFMLPEPVGLEEIKLDDYDLVIALSKAAYAQLRLLETQIKALEYWDVTTPPILGEAPPERLKEDYARIAKEIAAHIRNRFGIDVSEKLV